MLRSVLLWTAAMVIIPAAVIPREGERAVSAPVQEVHSEGVTVERIELTEPLITADSRGNITPVGVEDYTVYALLDQIPFVMSQEAMKAQAVAARTYAVRRILSGDSVHIVSGEDGYQGMLTDAQARAVYGEDYEGVLSAARSAVLATEGEILLYEGSPIIAAFHTASAGYTESGENVWGEDVPYLTAVESSWDKQSVWYRAEKRFTVTEVKARVSAYTGLETEAAEPQVIQATPSGTVISAQLCGHTFTGAELVKIFTLDSAAFELDCQGDDVIFAVSGSGNLAGMSMNGADCMAKNGADYRQILLHYYHIAD